MSFKNYKNGYPSVNADWQVERDDYEYNRRIIYNFD